MGIQYLYCNINGLLAISFHGLSIKSFTKDRKGNSGDLVNV